MVGKPVAPPKTGVFLRKHKHLMEEAQWVLTGSREETTGLLETPSARVMSHGTRVRFPVGSV